MVGRLQQLAVWRCGTVFRLTPPDQDKTDWTQTVLYNFCSVGTTAVTVGTVAGLIFDDQGAL